jgi:single-strand DNA-binding protein
MLNVICIEGRLCVDPELKHTQNDVSVCSFNVAVDRNYKNSDGNRQTDFLSVVCWRGLAEMVTKYFKKGQLIIVNGALETRKYTDNNDNKRTAYEIIASGVNFAGGKKESGETEQSSSNSAQASSSSDSVNGNDNGDFVEIGGDDDLPF